jgi:single-stranded DNA-specific DHH superfamily exonuclease
MLAGRSSEGKLIIGDYDADGATACAVGVKALRCCIRREVRFHVPDRSSTATELLGSCAKRRSAEYY